MKLLEGKINLIGFGDAGDAVLKCVASIGYALNVVHEQSVTQALKVINKLSRIIDLELFCEELESYIGYAHRD